MAKRLRHCVAWTAFTMAALAGSPRLEGTEPSMPIRSRSNAAQSGRPRPIDGVVPGRDNPRAGAAGIALVRWTDPDYADAMSSPAGQSRPGARAVSQILCREERAVPNPLGASSFLWQWGQFLDHDLDLTEAGSEAAPIPVPSGDPYFDPGATDQAVIPFFRSVYDLATGHAPDQPRQQVNEVTAYIDASNVYGSDALRATALRTRDGTGRLRTSSGDLLPFNVDRLANSPDDSAELFLAGDVRANEQIGLTALHVLFVREHNRWAARLAAVNPGWSGDRIYQQARRLVGAEMQAVTFREFLPLLLGPDAIPPYAGYQEEVDPSIANLFATVAYRVGHTMLNPVLLRVGPDGLTPPAGPLELRDAFFRPSLLAAPGALEELLRGLAAQRARAVDPFITDAVRNFLFGDPGAGGFDLAALNIQRGRDHGIPDYSACRQALGLAPKTSFAAISSDPEVQSRLQEAYGDVENVDAWAGGVSEDRLPGALVGELFHAILRRQFLNLRVGDPYWYQRGMDSATQNLVESLTLSRIIRLNTAIGDELPDNVFAAPDSSPY